MYQKPTIYWARPITTYSRTHLQAIEGFRKGKVALTEEELKLHQSLYADCLELENAVHDLLGQMDFEVVDPGSEKVANSFELWRNRSDENKANPMPFFTDLAESCNKIIFTCFDNALQSQNAPSATNRIGCGVVKEVNAWANAKQDFRVACLSYSADSIDGLIYSITYLTWPKNEDGEVLCDQNHLIQCDNSRLFRCLDYPQTKALLLLQGYKSRSSKHKNAQKK